MVSSARKSSRTLFVAAVCCSLASLGSCQSTSTLAAPGQPVATGAIGQFEIVGSSLVSAQQMFLGTLDKVYILDKTENNPTTINGHPAWAAEYSTSQNSARPMNAVTNTFCAGGNVLGNGTWVNVGGNQEVQYGGLSDGVETGGGPYDDPDGGYSIRLLDTCDDSSCEWILTQPMTTRRWYSTVETLEDGSLIIIGGDDWGGYVNALSQNNPTYEFFPSQGDPIDFPLLASTLPANLYPITFLLPSGLLLVQTNWATALLDYNTGATTMLDDVPDAVRTYPASAGTAMLPLTPANNWTATILFCGGSNLQTDQWNQNWDIASYPASPSCVRITPDFNGSYTQDDPLPEGRSMASIVILPTGKLFLLSGAGLGTAGYGNTSWAIGQSFADNPILMPVMYDPAAPKGQRWSRDGLSPSTVPRMYHSTALLLPDGSVMAGGSNPNADYNVGPNIKYPTEYRVERFYPSYYNERRPEPQGLLAQLGYGGPYFNVSLSSDDLAGNIDNIRNATVIVLRTGFSTHVLSMGQRYVELDSSYTVASDGSAVLHVSQLPPNPAILAPGPALLFVVVRGVPSIGVKIMVGSGTIEPQTTLAIATLPSSSIAAQQSSNTSTSSSGPTQKKSSAHYRSALTSAPWSASVTTLVASLIIIWR